MSARRAVFRTDASAALGAGHLVRSLALAGALRERGFECSFAVNEAAAETVPELADAGFGVVVLAAQRHAAPDALHEACAANVDWLIVDHYGLEARYESSCRDFARGVAVIDDLADRSHDCDVLVDQTPGRRAADYDGLVPRECRRLLGPGYALLHRQFAAARSGLMRPGQPAGRPWRILVSLGMTDPQGLTERVIAGIGLSGVDAVVDVVLGAAAPGLEAVCAGAARVAQPVSVHTQVSDMAALMLEADFAVGAAGVSALERCCLGLPSLNIVAAGNQAGAAAALADLGASAAPIPAARVDARTIGGLVGAMCGDTAALRRYAERSAALCDGAGAQRVADILAGLH